MVCWKETELSKVLDIFFGHHEAQKEEKEAKNVAKKTKNRKLMMKLV